MQESIFRDEDDLLQIIQKQINIVIWKKSLCLKKFSSKSVSKIILEKINRRLSLVSLAQPSAQLFPLPMEGW